MTAEILSPEGWLESRERNRAWCARVDAALPPPKRVRPRDPDEADFLRKAGTTEELIGPVPDRSQLAQLRAVLRARLPSDQAVEQWIWRDPHPIAGGLPPAALLVNGRTDDVLAAAQALPLRRRSVEPR